jgi:hypothetical protein
MNTPGEAEGNWWWRYQKGQIDQHLQDRLAELTAAYSRWNGPVPEYLDPRYRPKQVQERQAPGVPAEREAQTAP